MIEVSRMTKIASAVARGVDREEICENDEERTFFAAMVVDLAVMKESGIGLALPND